MQIAKAIFIRYFDGKKKIGNHVPEFIEQFNNVFICLVTTVIFHCLKSWESGVLDSGGPDFKSDTRRCEL